MKSKHFGIRVSPDLFKRICEQARRDSRTPSDFARLILERATKTETKGKK
jgi:predicted transcriptional regulator